MICHCWEREGKAEWMYEASFKRVLRIACNISQAGILAKDTRFIFFNVAVAGRGRWHVHYVYCLLMKVPSAFLSETNTHRDIQGTMSYFVEFDKHSKWLS